MNIKSQDWKKAERAILTYGRARFRFRKAEKELLALLCGNDNKVGIAGEYWAKRHYHRKGHRLTEVFASNNPGHDFKCQKGRRTIRVTVRAISNENKRGCSIRLPSVKHWDELCVILLGDDLRPYRTGRCTAEQFRRAFQERRLTSKDQRPKLHRSALNENGWISDYGEVSEDPCFHDN